MSRFEQVIINIILVVIGSALISLLEAYILEESFYYQTNYKPIRIINGAFTVSNEKISLNLICPNSFEKKIYKFILQDHRKSDPNFNPVLYVKDTKYINFPEEFINVDNINELNNVINSIDSNIKKCDYLLNLSKGQRITTLTLNNMFQPLHLIYGWLLALIFLKIFRIIKLIFYKISLKPIPNGLKRVGFFLRGLFRSICKLFKEIEKKGK